MGPGALAGRCASPRLPLPLTMLSYVRGCVPASPLNGLVRYFGEQPSLSASARGHLQGTGGSQPHVTWWGEEGIPRVGGTVQVLHEDGIWYPGMLTSCEGSKWHIHFEDGDQDVYTLPHRCAKVFPAAAPCPPASSSSLPCVRLISGLF